MAFRLDLESKRELRHVGNREGAFLDEKGVSLAQELRGDLWFVLEK